MWKTHWFVWRDSVLCTCICIWTCSLRFERKLERMNKRCTLLYTSAVHVPSYRNVFFINMLLIYILKNNPPPGLKRNVL